MGNSISVDHEKADSWWPPPHANTTEQTEQNNPFIEQTEQNNSSTQQTELIEPSVIMEPVALIVQTPIIEQNVLTKICASTQTEENTQEQTIYSENASSSFSTNEESDDINVYRAQNQLKLQKFKSDLEKKHLARREAIAERSREILFLREELAKYKKENEQLKELFNQNCESTETTAEQNIEEVKSELQWLKTENEELQNKITHLNEDLHKSNEILRQNQDLRKSIAETQKDLQAVNTQVVEFEKERSDYESHVIALKDVIRVSKRLLEIRENQLQELKAKVNEIETTLAEREVSIMSQNLKDEYEKQLENIRNLRAMYEQRQAATKAERDLMASELTDAKNILESEQKKNGEQQERIDELENNVSDKYDEIKSLESQLGLAKAEFRGLEAEMSVINQLFSQILYGFNNCQEINFDKLTKLLVENHDLLTNIVVNEESESMSCAMPKVLLDLVNRANEETKSENAEAEIENISLDACEASTSETAAEENLQEQQACNAISSAEEIVTKLPKVWRVLTELLRQQSGQLPVNIQEDGTGTDPCYKSVETPKGPKLVLSVSQTFIRLKDLILEKKSLETEMNRLKNLNTHLEVRLQDQEKRLETVSTELGKTWHVVGRMQKQHQQLHTHEKILRYELAQKRKMLTELKEELEYCREKWKEARVKNSKTEEEWKKLRIEFAARKTVVADDLNNSAESGYSDERECSSDEEYREKKNKKLISKSVDSEQTSDTDTEETNVAKSDNTDVQINNLENIIMNNNIQGQEELASSSESNLQKTNFVVQNQREKTVPASLDMIDDVCALGTIPVSISTIIETNSDETPSTSSEEITRLDEIPPRKLEEIPQTLLQETAATSLEENPPRSLDGAASTISGEIIISLDEIPSTKLEEILQTRLEETPPTRIEEPKTRLEEAPATSLEENPSRSLDETGSTISGEITRLDEIPPTKLEETPTTRLEEMPATIMEQNPSRSLDETASTISGEITRFNEKSVTKLDEIPQTRLEEAPPARLEEISATISEEITRFDEIPPTKLDEKLRTRLEETQPTRLEETRPNRLEETTSTSKKNSSTNLNETASTSTSLGSLTTPSQKEINQDERLRRREERLQRLEEQCQQLVTKVTNTNNRSTDISNRLETLHEQYGNDNARTNGQESDNAETENNSE